MPNREVLFMRTVPAGLAALAVAWTITRWQPSGGISLIAQVALWAFLAAPVALVLLGAPRAGVWILMELALLAIPYAIAASWLREAGYTVLGIAYLAPLAIGWPGAAVAWIVGTRASGH